MLSIPTKDIGKDTFIKPPGPKAAPKTRIYTDAVIGDPQAASNSNNFVRVLLKAVTLIVKDGVNRSDVVFVTHTKHSVRSSAKCKRTGQDETH